MIGYRTAPGEYVVIGDQAGVKGERHTIYPVNRSEEPIPVQVLDSRPTIFRGSVQHEVRLIALEAETTGNRGTEGE